MSEKEKRIITIGRQFGAGGRSVGKQLAERLGMDFYDKELIVEAARESGLSHKLLDNMDEQPTTSLLYSLVMNMQNQNLFGGGKPIELVAYETQISSVKNVAQKGPCVIVGRAADCILQKDYDIVSFFLVAPLEERIERVAHRDGLSKADAAKKIARLDKARASFYNGFSEKRWGMAESYDCCINAGGMDEEAIVELMLNYICRCRKM